MGTKTDNLHPTQAEIIAILEDTGAATTRLLVHRLDDDDAYRQLVYHHLDQLQEAGLVRKADERLYTLAEGGENE